MPLTTERDVFDAVLADVKGIDVVADAHVYLRAVPGFDPDVNPPFIQVVPGSGEVVNYEAGADLIRQTFQTVIFVRLNLDQMGRDTSKLQDATRGLMALRNGVRGDAGAADPNNPTGLIHRRLGGDDLISVHPIVLLSWAQPTTNPGDMNWVSATDTWRVMWELY